MYIDALSKTKVDFLKPDMSQCSLKSFTISYLTLYSYYWHTQPWRPVENRVLKTLTFIMNFAAVFVKRRTKMWRRLKGVTIVTSTCVGTVLQVIICFQPCGNTCWSTNRTRERPESKMAAVRMYPASNVTIIRATRSSCTVGNTMTSAVPPVEISTTSKSNSCIMRGIRKGLLGVRWLRHPWNKLSLNISVKFRPSRCLTLDP